MLDALDPTNVDAKGLPFTVRYFFFLKMREDNVLNNFRAGSYGLRDWPEEGYTPSDFLPCVHRSQFRKWLEDSNSTAYSQENFHLIQDEILRVVDSLQLGDKYLIKTPVNWQKGDAVIVHPSVSNEEAKTLFPEHTVHKVIKRFLA